MAKFSIRTHSHQDKTTYESHSIHHDNGTVRIFGWIDKKNNNGATLLDTHDKRLALEWHFLLRKGGTFFRLGDDLIEDRTPHR